jgi:DNA-directed RNA polymerase subunit RPC12/RpoP
MTPETTPPTARPCECYGASINWLANDDCYECGRCGHRWLHHTQQRDPPRRTLRPSYAHDWQEYMDGELRCSACGRQRKRTSLFNFPCNGAGKVTVDVG